MKLLAWLSFAAVLFARGGIDPVLVLVVASAWFIALAALAAAYLDATRPHVPEQRP